MDILALRILKLFIEDKNILLTFLQKKFNISKNKVIYQVKTINQFLKINNLGYIKKNGLYYIFNGKQKLLKEQFHNISPIIYLNKDKRQGYLYLIILLNTNQTLEAIANKLYVSKNTLFSDKNKLKTYLEHFQISIKFSRKKGFYFEGNEISIRRLGIRFIREIEKDTFDVSLSIINIDINILKKIKEKILKLEKHLNLEFTGYKRMDLYLISYMCYIRYVNGYGLIEGELGEYIQMVGKEFYDKIANSFYPFFTEKKSSDEIKFLAIQILSTNLIKGSSLHQDKVLLQKINQFIKLFEISGITKIKQKSKLRQELYQHLIPAYYRIKFGLPDNNLLITNNIKNYDFVNSLVKNSIYILENYLNITFPESELTYISIILLNSISEEISNKKAILVCQQGISISTLIAKEIKSLFSNIDIISIMSVKEFYQNSQDNFDIIFSDCPLKTNKDLFIIHSLFNIEDKLQLIKNVDKRLYSQQNSVTMGDNKFLNNILKIIKQNTDIINKKRLTDELKNYTLNLQIKKNIYLNEESSPSLNDLLPLSHIQIYSKVNSVPEAIKIAVRPLISEGFVNKNYESKIIDLYDSKFSYMAISQDVAIPHASPKDGVNQIGISFLKLDNPIKFSKNMLISFIFIIAPEDKQKHIRAITQIYDMSKNKLLIAKMKQLQHRKDFKNYFDCISK